ncbi:peptidoglycan-binding domain-containing protein [Pseudooctadecabacter jejudonensis]|uniref:Peptidoglycan binding-like domain-containing protein n=1 Tax=Pseudooctadecabacter jejudonensis TaxID=1391910 RepID=A0A1Y5RMI6_9RHOB|nr:peptidoglycan-binding domain-containing protein [Pseudooctadecabacter jejudonensis]SLN20772.1 hypothetical protein PSJ8397_00786 [Pseudooctadecabacter jejudonensis]
MIKPIPLLGLVLACATATGCMEASVARAPTAPAADTIAPLSAPEVVDAQTGTCFARTTTPALIETVTEQIMVQPALIRSDGSVETPAAFRTVTRQRIVRERREVEFETPCARVLTPPFVASVQRALLARGYYRGPITGVQDARTRAAIGRFQADRDDVLTDMLTLRTARDLGLVAVPRDTL